MGTPGRIFEGEKGFYRATSKDFDLFRQMLKDAGIETSLSVGSCFRWCTFPSGEIYFCCMGQHSNLAGHLARESFETILERTKEACGKNNRMITELLLSGSGMRKGFLCNSCPLRVANRD